MQRKLVRQGKTALTVTLPKKWIDFNGLEAGNYVEISEEENKELKIFTKRRTVEKKLSLDISALNVKTIQQILTGAYEIGVTDLTLNYKNQEIEHTKRKYQKIEFKDQKIKEKVKVIDVITNTIQILIGFEIIEQGENKVTIKQISKVEEEDFKATFRRIFYLLEGMNNYFLEQVENISEHEIIIQNKILDIRKFINYGLRLINLKVINKNQNLTYSILKLFEDITYIYEFITGFASKQNKLEESTKEMFKDLGEIFSITHKAYYTFSLKSYTDFDLKLREIYHRHNISYKKVKKEDLRIKQMLTSCAMDLTAIMNNILAMNLEKT